MSRRRLYHTAEERRLAANAKSRRSYHKNKMVIRTRRQEEYQKAKAQRLELRPKRLTGDDSPCLRKQNESDSAPEDDSENVKYWTVKVERIARKFVKYVGGDSAYNYVESLYTRCVETHDIASVFRALVDIERLEKCIRTYQDEILQLAGAQDEWKRAGEVAEKVNSVLQSLEDLGTYATLPGQDLPVLHASKELLFQSLLA